MTYAEKLLDPRWQKKRLQVFERDNFTCLSCNSTKNTLHVHHLKYLPGLDPWDYELSYMVTYCHICHETEHLIGSQVQAIHLEVIKENPMLIKPMAQATNLISEFPPFRQLLNEFMNETTIRYLKWKEAAYQQTNRNK